MSRYVALPSLEVLLRAFADGALPARVGCAEVVELALELVDVHCRVRAAQNVLLAYMEAPHDRGEQWAGLMRRWITGLEEIACRVALIDEAVRQRSTPVPDSLTRPAHIATETVGQVISRMASLWVAVADDEGADHEPLAEAHALAQLGDGYASLIDGLAHGTVQLPRVSQWELPSPRATNPVAVVRSPRAALDAAIAELAESGACMVERRSASSAVVTIAGRQPWHGLHAAVTVSTWGWWLPVWLARIHASRPRRWWLRVDETGQVHRTPTDQSGRSTIATENTPRRL
ncbi:hypothetical protein [Nocardia miyunensis]|uniref:hypothetical protein n=1 Tax=Nocardia miyunensis TaxID=282684 RepID=UPI00082A2FB2|nr:hypothetical protein [Nocardia miyunensis]